MFVVIVQAHLVGKLCWIDLVGIWHTMHMLPRNINCTPASDVMYGNLVQSVALQISWTKILITTKVIEYVALG